MEKYIFTSIELQFHFQFVGLFLGSIRPLPRVTPKVPPSLVFTDLKNGPLLSFHLYWQFFRKLFAFVSLHYPLLYEPRKLFVPDFPCILSKNLPS